MNCLIIKDFFNFENNNKIVYIEPFFGINNFLFGNYHTNIFKIILNDEFGYLCNLLRIYSNKNEVPILIDKIIKQPDFIINNNPNIEEQLRNDYKWYDIDIAAQWCYYLYSLQYDTINVNNIKQFLQIINDVSYQSKITCGKWMRVVTPVILKNLSNNINILFDVRFKNQELIQKIYNWINNLYNMNFPNKYILKICIYTKTQEHIELFKCIKNINILNENNSFYLLMEYSK